jgi:hypothetical protein
MKSHDLVVVRTFPTPIAAELARSALEAANIDSFLQADDCGGLRPHMLLARGVALMVRAEDAKRAATILDAA